MEEGRMEVCHKFFPWMIVLCLCVSIISGIASGWYFSRAQNEEIVVLDVAKIIEAKQKEFVEKYKNREPNPRLKEEMDREVSSFMVRLNNIVEEESKGKILLTRDAVISSVRDITDEVSNRIKNSN